MPAHPVILPPLKSNQERSIDIDPCKQTLHPGTQPVKNLVKEPTTTSGRLLLIAFVGLEVGHHVAIEADFAHTTAVKGRIPIEKRTPQIESIGLDLAEHLLEILVKLVGIMMIAGDRFAAREHIATSITQGDDVGRLGLFSPLIGHFFAAFLGRRVAAIEIQHR